MMEKESKHNAMLAPSVMCISEWKGSEYVLRELKEGGADLLHVDVMDGEFVSNLMLGTESIRYLRKAPSTLKVQSICKRLFPSYGDMVRILSLH